MEGREGIKETDYCLWSGRNCNGECQTERGPIIRKLFSFRVVVEIGRIGQVEVFKDERSEKPESPSHVSIVRLICPDGKLVIESLGDAMVVEQRLSDLSHLHRRPHELHPNGIFVGDPIHGYLPER